MWQRAGAVRLFVEHVTLLNESDDDEVNSASVVTLWKVFTNASYGLFNNQNLYLETSSYREQKHNCTQTELKSRFGQYRQRKTHYGKMFGFQSLC